MRYIHLYIVKGRVNRHQSYVHVKKVKFTTNKTLFLLICVYSNTGEAMHRSFPTVWIQLGCMNINIKVIVIFSYGGFSGSDVTMISKVGKTSGGGVGVNLPTQNSNELTNYVSIIYWIPPTFRSSDRFYFGQHMGPPLPPPPHLATILVSGAYSSCKNALESEKKAESETRTKKSLYWKVNRGW